MTADDAAIFKLWARQARPPQDEADVHPRDNQGIGSQETSAGAHEWTPGRDRHQAGHQRRIPRRISGGFQVVYAGEDHLRSMPGAES